jgi:hypothetical protein
MSSRFRIVALLTVFALAMGGWSAFGVVGQGQAGGPPENLDDLLARVAEQVPGFGGLHLEGDVLKVHLTDPAQQGAAERAIAVVFGVDRLPAGGAQVVPAQYGFRELKAWQRDANALLSLEGVVFTDADEVANRVLIGIDREELRGRVEAELRRLGVPADASAVVVTEPVVQLVTLRDRVRPLQGGLQINFPGYLCTYGFNAVRAGVNGFVTNSHCTTKQGGVEGTKYWQPLQTVDATSIGTEIADPVYSKANCPKSVKGKVCRQSDSSFARLEVSDYDLGGLAQTTGLGSLTLAGTYRITGEQSTVTVGTTVNKVGRTTGWSQGKVTNTCVNTGVSGSNVVQLCQNFVSAAVDSGDSGSPVFMISGSNANATLAGILWGGSGTTTFVYSPIGNVEAELGALTTQ